MLRFEKKTKERCESWNPQDPLNCIQTTVDETKQTQKKRLICRPSQSDTNDLKKGGQGMCDDNTRAFMKEHGVWNDQKLIFVIYGQPHGFKRTVLPVAMELLQTDHRQARWWLFDLRPSNRTLRWHSASTCRNLSTFSTSNRERWTRQVSTCHSLHREENRQGKLHFWQRRRCSAESVAFDRLKKRIWNFDCQFLRIITTIVKLLKSTAATSLLTWWMPINSLMNMLV